MPRITRVYTKTGDDGTTALVGGQRVGKDSLRITTYGTVDELNSALGVVLAQGVDPALVTPLMRIQNELFHLGADLSTPEAEKIERPGPRIEARHVSALEELMDTLSRDLAPLANFVLPGGTTGAAGLHLARTICRRAERWLVALRRHEAVGEQALAYLNRLSDALFVMARWENHAAGRSDVVWDSRA